MGDTRIRKLDVRIIAATNRDLKERVREGSFREDLFFRLERHPDRPAPSPGQDEDILPARSPAPAPLRRARPQRHRTLARSSQGVHELPLARKRAGDGERHRIRAASHGRRVADRPGQLPPQIGIAAEASVSPREGLSIEDYARRSIAALQATIRKTDRGHPGDQPQEPVGKWKRWGFSAAGEKAVSPDSLRPGRRRERAGQADRIAADTLLPRVIPPWPCVTFGSSPRSVGRHPGRNAIPVYLFISISYMLYPGEADKATALARHRQ